MENYYKKHLSGALKIEKIIPNLGVPISYFKIDEVSTNYSGNINIRLGVYANETIREEEKNGGHGAPIFSMVQSILLKEDEDTFNRGILYTRLKEEIEYFFEATDIWQLEKNMI